MYQKGYPMVYFEVNPDKLDKKLPWSTTP